MRKNDGVVAQADDGPRGVPQQSPSDVLRALADRCEREEPSRELDREIFRSVGTIDEAQVAAWCGQNGRNDLTRARYIAAWAPVYTTSLDAAVTLEPKDALEVCVRKYPNGAIYVRLTMPSGDPIYCENFEAKRVITEPMARLAIYLRARAAMEKGDAR